MTYRELPFEEWHKLANHEGMQGYPLPPQTHGRVFVAENEAGEIKAFWWVISVVHTEPAWISPELRGTIIAKPLFEGMCQILDTCSVAHAYCFADRPEVASYLERFGYLPLAVQTFILLCPTSPSPVGPQQSTEAPPS